MHTEIHFAALCPQTHISNLVTTHQFTHFFSPKPPSTLQLHCTLALMCTVLHVSTTFPFAREACEQLLDRLLNVMELLGLDG